VFFFHWRTTAAGQPSSVRRTFRQAGSQFLLAATDRIGVQPRDEAHQGDPTVPQAIGFPSHKPPPVLFVGPTEQQIQLGMPLPVGVFVRLHAIGALASVYCILHKSLSHP
jgi:hypothetical protein